MKRNSEKDRKTDMEEGKGFRRKGKGREDEKRSMREREPILISKYPPNWDNEFCSGSNPQRVQVERKRRKTQRLHGTTVVKDNEDSETRHHILTSGKINTRARPVSRKGASRV
jgi:hypothetical protein